MRQTWPPGFLPVDKNVTPEEDIIFGHLIRRHYGVDYATRSAYIHLIDAMLREVLQYVD